MITLGISTQLGNLKFDSYCEGKVIMHHVAKLKVKYYVLLILPGTGNFLSNVRCWLEDLQVSVKLL